jgi:hypothetical protein
LKDDRTGHRQFDDAEGSAILIDHAAQTGEVFAQRVVVLVERVLLDGGDDRSQE